ncbi:MAG: alpha/beta hydrolase [Myxococcales bacterium]|nr:alpha/beta hydrolase [Myxococcales bacterium]
MLLFAALLTSGVLAAPPAQPDPSARYVFYLHGKIIEDAGRKPNHPRWGAYDYDAVLAALAGPGRLVISQQRKPNTRVGTYARVVAAQVEELLAAGVPADHVTVVGFSKGGVIAQHISRMLAAPIRYALLASCSKMTSSGDLHGHILSIREQSDTMMGSCAAAFKDSPRLAEHHELTIAIGGEHGAFYRPHRAWLKPLLAWIDGKAPARS